MNIVYGLSGEGRGHSSLAKEVIPLLKGAGHRVKVVTYGQSVAELKKYSPTEIQGIKHYYNKDGQLSLPKTVIHNLSYFAYLAKNWRRLRNELSAFSPDVFVCNFEPLTARLARSLKKPLISLDNQHSILHLTEKIPLNQKLSFWTTKIATLFSVPFANYYIIMDFNKANLVNKNAYFITPLIQEEIRSLVPHKGKSILVYLKRPNASLVETLKGIPEKFVVYGFNQDKKDGNIIYKNHGDRFLEDLKNCKAIIGTAGLSLIPEAIYLKKPFFGVPLKNEFEQTLNSMFIKDNKFGDFSESPTKNQLVNFLNKLGLYEQTLKKYNFNDAEAKKIVLKIISLFSSRE